MEALKTLGWAVWIMASYLAVEEFFGYGGIVRMFPEGKRWWMTPAQMLALLSFTMAVVHSPWS